MKKIIYTLSGILLLASCTKISLNEYELKEAPQELSNKTLDSHAADANSSTAARAQQQFILYNIAQGQHSSDKSVLKSVRLSSMNFIARFDNSAIYQSVNPENQYDINKLYGFSEGFNHQYNSARIGWAYNDGALRLYAYAYNNGIRASQEITTVSIGTDISCNISVSGNLYLFTVNNSTVSLSRANSTATASGYQLYPYFGGDEVAPHNIRIQIKKL